MRSVIKIFGLSIVQVIAILGLLSTVPVGAETEATKRLKERNKEFRKDVIKISEGVYTAVGYTVSSNSMIIGDDGIIIVDPGQTVRGAKEVQLSSKRLRINR